MSENNAVEILIVEDTPEDPNSLRALRKGQSGESHQIARDGAEAIEFIFC